MCRVGSALEDAAAEAVNSPLKVELVHRRRYATRAQAGADVGAWIVTFYNARRRHTAGGGPPPIDHETLITAAPHADVEDQAA